MGRKDSNQTNMYIEGCTPLSEPLNGDVDITGGLLGILGGYLYAVGSYALYECDRGYELSNETARECMPIGSSYDWSGTASTCDPVCKYGLYDFIIMTSRLGVK